MAKFDDVTATVLALEAAALRVGKFKPNTAVTSERTPSRVQVTAMLDLFRRMKIGTQVTAKVGAWRKQLILTDIIVNYHDVQTRIKTGEEATVVSHLMLRAMHAVRTIVETNMPGLRKGYCPVFGIVDGFYRFQ